MFLGERLKHVWTSEKARSDISQLMLLAPLFALIFSGPFLQQVFGPWYRYVGLGIIVGYVMFLIMLNKIEQANAARFLAFPKSIWRLSETEKASQDIFVKNVILLNDEEVKAEAQNSENIGKLKDDKYYYFVEFTPPVKLGRLGVFDKAVWIMPEKWEEMFQFTPGLTAWYKALVITHPKAEFVTLYIPSIKSRIEYLGETIPVCYVADSTWHFRKHRKPLEANSEVDVEEVESAKIAFLLRENIKLRQTLKYMDEHVEALMKAYPEVTEMALRTFDIISTTQGRIYSMPLTAKLKAKLTWKRVLIIAAILFIIYVLWVRGVIPH